MLLTNHLHAVLEEWQPPAHQQQNSKARIDSDPPHNFQKLERLGKRLDRVGCTRHKY